MNLIEGVKTAGIFVTGADMLIPHIKEQFERDNLSENSSSRDLCIGFKDTIISRAKFFPLYTGTMAIRYLGLCSTLIGAEKLICSLP